MYENYHNKRKIVGYEHENLKKKNTCHTLQQQIRFNYFFFNEVKMEILKTTYFVIFYKRDWKFRKNCTYLVIFISAGKNRLFSIIFSIQKMKYFSQTFL